jgi:hypothetical protein
VLAIVFQGLRAAALRSTAEVDMPVVESGNRFARSREGQAVNGYHDKQAVPSYQPSRLASDVMMILAQRGFEASLHTKDLVQAHQSAWNLLTIFGIRPDTDGCPCLACGGAELTLGRLNSVAADDPELTGQPRRDGRELTDPPASELPTSSDQE